MIVHEQDWTRPDSVRDGCRAVVRVPELLHAVEHRLLRRPSTRTVRQSANGKPSASASARASPRRAPCGLRTGARVTHAGAGPAAMASRSPPRDALNEVGAERVCWVLPGGTAGPTPASPYTDGPRQPLPPGSIFPPRPRTAPGAHNFRGSTDTMSPRRKSTRRLDQLRVEVTREGAGRSFAQTPHRFARGRPGVRGENSIRAALKPDIRLHLRELRPAVRQSPARSVPRPAATGSGSGSSGRLRARRRLRSLGSLSACSIRPCGQVHLPLERPERPVTPAPSSARRICSIVTSRERRADEVVGRCRRPRGPPGGSRRPDPRLVPHGRPAGSTRSPNLAAESARPSPVGLSSPCRVSTVATTL